MSKVKHFQKGPTSQNPKNKKPDPLEGVYKAIGALTKECENIRNNAAISVGKCYASTQALVELFVKKGLLAEVDQEVYLMMALRNFHKSSLEDIEAGLAELESGRSVAPENVVEGMKGEAEYHEEILAKIDEAMSAVEVSEKTYHEFIKELSAYLNEKYDLH